MRGQLARSSSEGQATPQRNQSPAAERRQWVARGGASIADACATPESVNNNYHAPEGRQIACLSPLTAPALENKAIPPADAPPSTKTSTRPADLTAPTPPDLAALLAGLGALTAGQRAALVALLAPPAPPAPPLPSPAPADDDLDRLPWERRPAVGAE